MKHFYINFVKDTPVWTEFFPNEGTEAINKRPEAQEFYREEVSEIKINRRGPGRSEGDNVTVYDTLETWFTDETKFNDEIEIEIYTGTMGGGTLYFAGFFSISDTTIDKVNKIFKFTPRIDDNYRGIMEGAQADYDIIIMSGFSEDLIAGEYNTLGAWTAEDPLGAGAYDDFNTFTGSGSALTSVIDSDVANVQARNQSVGVLTDGSKAIIKINSFTLNSGTGPYIDLWDVNNNVKTDEGGQQITDTTDIEFTIDNGGAVELFIVIYTTPANQVTNFAINLEVIENGSREVNTGKLFMDFIEDYITTAVFMGLTGFIGNVKSTFINNDALPSDAPSSIVTTMTNFPNGNYVSGSQATNPLNGFLIGQTRDWVDSDVTSINISFGQLMSNLLNIIQTGWYIDADGDFRIEHVKYFEKLVDDSTALDLTSAPFDKYKPEVDFTEINYDKSVLANREQFKWQQVDTVALSQDFVGEDIIYENLETIENTFKYEPRNITTDLRYLRDNPSEGSADGLMYLLGVELVSNDYYIDFEEGVLSGDQILNGHFSWANLQDKYWTWRRMSENGDMNDGDTVAFDSAVKFLEQSGIKFGRETALDPFTKITTSQGTGQQLETTRNLDTDFLTVLIAFNPYS